MKWYQMGEEEVKKATGVLGADGLPQREVDKRLKRVGFNKLDEGESVSALILFFMQFKDFMVLVLLAATLISGLLGEYIDAITIILIILLNGVLGFIQERKAEKSLSALKELSAPQMVVLRDGKWLKVPAATVVPGDVVKLTSGDRVGADIRLLETASLRIEESSLTGESLPVHKHGDRMEQTDLQLGDQANMAFMGTLVTEGQGIGIVVATGMKTEMGKIAHLLQTTETVITPLQRKLEQLGKVLIAVALLLTAMVVVIGVIQGHDAYTMFLAGVSLAVAAIPEGLPAIVTVALALGVQRMIKRRAIVRKLPAVETLGCASVICSDKTGTLTQNKMTVTQVWASGETWHVSGTGYEPHGLFTKGKKETDPKRHRSLHLLLSYGLLCNNSQLKQRTVKKGMLKTKESTAYHIEGDPTEGALLVAAMKAGFSREQLDRQFKRLKEFPFESTRKMMSVVVENEKGQRFVVAKGAPDVILQVSKKIRYRGEQEALTPKRREEVERTIQTMASQALRTIAVAYRPLRPNESVDEAYEAECDLTFIGLQGMIDPPREEVFDSIEECRQAGIKTVMITGDHRLTAAAIAKKLGILPAGGKVIDGTELNHLTDRRLTEMVDQIYVYARVSPEHKLKIVKAMQERGHIVAMTGDGVNDAPAIKAANIGIAMGITGTDVAKEASSLILSDDNFATIRAAIREGRNIYDNIRKFIRYMLASNVGEILVMLFAMLLGMPLPLVATQILWINLVTDGLPAMALGMDQPEGNVMKRPPRHPREGIFARGLAWKIVSRGFMIGVVTLAAFWLTLQANPDDLTRAQSVAFVTLVMAQLIHVFDCRSEYSVFHRNPFENKYLVLAVLSSVLLMLIVIYYPPLQQVFHTVPLTGREWLLIIGMAAIPTVVLGGFRLLKAK
ncbi:calcium-translocating P-type ATPase, SERCA-type [Halalkalibacterium halodurans]|uniref:P-type Ca(2+) transporter n=2 Tax=Halalkalibacterium halodurans TaxID=86665 RepID=Q9K9X9_HALH5|nr:calcium-translocating P-type ATPase, SERCA-type [Halalkalibacterium halodurans]MED4081490.1 calcium-translocating P-type ATPase, SERCA-type [Halalkalibacterium halodurans]MED4086106.1 calcium-translocating P-type ATPase, SERCA-type [Halalkalibacterium halodurans]MED4106252.1 calcium-translocating P-type ATPase, SERCA-type [Halalkalibacterium halodurans]MED4108665.1 calcium-translocating P-type ATPase, SERCA-type [Halalkalibacterium halodurans]MED4149098.1 calcium-translocating P-type ATPase